MSFTGHCYGYLSPIQTVLTAAGRENYLIGNKGQDRVFHLVTGTIPAFTYWCDERNVGQPEGLNEEENADAIRAGHEAAIFNDLRELNKTYGFTADDVIVINTLRHWAIRGVVQFAESLGSKVTPRFSIISLFSSEPHLGVLGPARRHYAEAFDSILKSPRASKIRVFADADTLITEYAELSNLHIDLAPFPQWFDAPRQDVNIESVRLSYTGEAREHKGFHFLPYVAEQLAKTGSSATLEVQTFTHDQNQPFYQKAMATLATAKNVCLIQRILSEDEFRDFQNRTDVFLLAYGVADYHRQTSVVYAAAAALRAPVIASRGTWMGNKVKERGGGELSNPDDCLSVAEAALKIVRDFRRYKAEALDASQSWRHFNNAENFVAVVI